jgi:hypothetical protein
MNVSSYCTLVSWLRMRGAMHPIALCLHIVAVKQTDIKFMFKKAEIIRKWVYKIQYEIFTILSVF